MNVKNWVWTEKYRPTKIDDCILPERIKETIIKLGTAESIPNLIFTGPPGIGKTTVARILASDIKAEILEINASMYGNIDTLRTEILQFVTTQSIEYDKKCVILDEADYLNPSSTQPALRHFMEEYHDVLFIFTCNYLNKIIEPLHSRTTVIDFKLTTEEKATAVIDFYKKAYNIMCIESSGMEIDRTSLSKLVQKYFPDFRRIINEMQRYINSNGKIDSGILGATDKSIIQTLIPLIQAKNYMQIRTWCMQNSDFIGDANFYGMIYDCMKDLIQQESITALLLILADYQYKHAFVLDKELNAAACIASIMSEVNFR